MEIARNASPNDDFKEKLFEYLAGIDATLKAIKDALTSPSGRSDADIEDMAIYFLYQVGPNLTEITRQMELQGVHVRRQSLAEAKKFSRFQARYDAYRGNGPRGGFKKDDGDVEAIE